MQASQQLNSAKSFSSKLLKLSFCDLLSNSTESGRSGTNRGGRREEFVSSVESRDHVNGHLCARTGTATTEENHFGSSCCFMAEY